MKVAAVTITCNRLELTKKTVESFYSKTKVDYHLFVDNGSIDGTNEWLMDHYDYIRLERNYGIAYAFKEAVKRLKGYDYILKLDNDIETITDDIIAKMLDFYSFNKEYVCSPVDINLDPAFMPATFGLANLDGFNVRFVTHTGGAFQMIPYSICERLCVEFKHLKAGDYMIGRYFKKHAYRPVYLTDLEMSHIGLNQSCKNYVL